MSGEGAMRRGIDMRTVTNFTISDEGRDHGKTFVLTEMSASLTAPLAPPAGLGLLAHDDFIDAAGEGPGRSV